MVVSKDMRREVSVLKQQLQTFYQVNNFISSVHNINQLLDLIMQEAEAAVGAEASCIGLLEPSGEHIKIAYASGEKKAQVQQLTMPMGHGILGQVAATNTSLKVDEVSRDHRFDPWIDQKTGFTTRCVLATPISRHNQVQGVLEVLNKRGSEAFTDDDVRLLEVVANQAAIALENAQLVAKLVQAERLAAVGRLAASIVHDFKSPMTVVRGFIELMENAQTTGEDRKAITKMMLEDLDRMADMAQDLLDYSTGDIRLHIHEVNLEDWLNSRSNYLREFFSAAKMNFEVESGFQGKVHMDPERMRRVLINIAANAKDAMPAGGTFRIATGQVGDYWELVLEDNGKGIPSEVRSRIFDPFVTYGKAYGTGLGLAITQEIVEQHGGTIQIQSRTAGEDPSKPSGTIFFLRLPIDPTGADSDMALTQAAQ